MPRIHVTRLFFWTGMPSGGHFFRELRKFLDMGQVSVVFCLVRGGIQTDKQPNKHTNHIIMQGMRLHSKLTENLKAENYF